MILNAQSPVAFGQASSAIQVDTIDFDLTNHVFTVQYYPQGGGPVPGTAKVRGPIPAALQTALENHVAAVVGADTGQPIVIATQ